MRAATLLCVTVVGLAMPSRVSAQDQFVVVEATYTATAQNTSDSHYRVSPDPGTPDDWRSPIDYASGTAHARLEVFDKPSTQKTLYNICFEATPSYACMPYSPAYTAPGVYDFEYPFSSFYQYDAVDWSQGVNKVALILKDENGTKKQGDPAFYPTTIRLTLTIVKPGATYVPPPDPVPDAGAPDAGAATPDAGSPVSDAALDTGTPAIPDGGAGNPWPALPDAGNAAGAGGGAGMGLPDASLPVPSYVAPQTTAPRINARPGGCTVVANLDAPATRAPLLALWAVLLTACRPRRFRRRH